MLLLLLFIQNTAITIAAEAEISRLILNKSEATLEVGASVSLTVTAVYVTGSQAM
ncbi:hypothetical protein [Paenibacillus pabuli]|uniref:hypothetical protein n=1 Tax=Paenibacillus pabuli TaxID=1472 RepID=UPI001FFF5095|nr:hypothetical protein [Paenibacillus pabuli]UPK43210.1 hypothetical protein KET34_29590 [Paenibacillus pabuli]